LSSDVEAPATEAATEEEPQANAPPADPVREAVVASLRDALGDDLLASEIDGADVWVRVAPQAWRRAAQVAREQLGMTYFCFLSGIDWKQNPDLGAQKVWDPAPSETPTPEDGPGAWVTGRTGGDTRFQVLCRLYNVRTKVGITLKADAGDDNPTVDSLVPVFRGADWHEREAWEMYGFDFPGHPGLRHLYLPTEFEGHPLRKDFPLLARDVKPWPGLVDVEGLPGEPEGEGGDAEGAEGAEE
jgi:NADH-quinone oxidoreductase subunit C